MSLQARYFPAQDRMLLTLPVAGAEKRLWVTRRHWIDLLAQLASRVPQEKRDDDKAQAPRGRPAAAPRGGEPDDALLVCGIRVRGERDRFGIAFAVSQEEAITLNIGDEGASQILRLLEMQADRAGWDFPAAMQRLHASRVAGAVLKRAKAD